MIQLYQFIRRWFTS